MEVAELVFVQHLGMESSKLSRSGFSTESLRWVTKLLARDTWGTAAFITELKKSKFTQLVVYSVDPRV